ncbi:MAG: hypothetical protein LUC32_07220 [Clostridiales bacterium]|nr:hypothetical protein [Clostridiales bacterium]
MNEQQFREKINSTREKYNDEVAQIPQIEGVMFTDKSAWAQFLTADLQNQKYILYIDKEMLSKNVDFIEQILFHEFTHLADSQTCLQMQSNDFKAYMSIFSETHASEVQMDRMLLTEKERPFSLEQEVTHAGILTLDSFMSQTKKHLVEEFSFPEGRINKTNLRFDSKELYYYVGYAVSLKKHGINYEVDFTGVPECFQEIFAKISTALMEYGEAEELIALEHELQDSIKNEMANHNRKSIDNIVEQLLKRGNR